MGKYLLAIDKDRIAVTNAMLLIVLDLIAIFICAMCEENAVIILTLKVIYLNLAYQHISKAHFGINHTVCELPNK